MKKLRFYLLITLTILIALILSVLPIPEMAKIFWPEWVMLTIIYWCLAMPTKLNITFAWMTGISVDLLNGYIIGQHALAYTLVAAVTVYFHSQIRTFPLIQQSFSIGALLILYFLMKIWIDGMLYPSVPNWQQVLPILSSTIIWPWIFFMLRLIRYKISTPN